MPVSGPFCAPALAFCPRMCYYFREVNAMELRVLLYFLTVAREENITKAAEVLHMTQPTLSRQLSQLEEELGVRLFERGARHITLTNEGVLLRRRAQELVSLADKTERELAAQSELMEGEISLGCGVLDSVAVLADLLDSFSRLNPGVTFEVFTSAADVIRDRMDHGLTDVGLLLEPVSMDSYEFIRLGVRESWMAVMRPDDPLAAQEGVTAADLARRELIMPLREAVKNELASWFGELYPSLRIRYTSNISTNAAILAQKGFGILVVIAGSLPFLDASKLVMRPLSPPLSSTSVLAWKRGVPLSPAATRFIEHARCFPGIGKHEN